MEVVAIAHCSHLHGLQVLSQLVKEFESVKIVGSGNLLNGVETVHTKQEQKIYNHTNKHTELTMTRKNEVILKRKYLIEI